MGSYGLGRIANLKFYQVYDPKKGSFHSVRKQKGDRDDSIAIAPNIKLDT
jgi:hypothetical protein